MSQTESDMQTTREVIPSLESSSSSHFAVLGVETKSLPEWVKIRLWSENICRFLIKNLQKVLVCFTFSPEGRPKTDAALDSFSRHGLLWF